MALGQTIWAYVGCCSSVAMRGARGGPPLAAIRRGLQKMGVRLKKMEFLNLLSYVSA